MASEEKFQLYFLALVPPEPVLSTVQTIKNEFFDAYRLKASLNSPPHITLQMPFRYPHKKEAHLLDQLNNIHYKSPIDIHLDGFGAFAPKVIFIRVGENDQLKEFQQIITQAMRRGLNILNTNYKDQVFRPHMTVAFRDLKKSTFPEIWKAYADKSIHLKWKTTSFYLMKHDGKVWNAYKEFKFLEQSSKS